ncbi:MAG TPA: hypothetical protein VFF82_07155 [Rhodocyclaceae bacterium]|nr:hypothetical protein [Rhodocyclaceae bacterium]
MNIVASDFFKLRWNLAILVLAAIAGVAMVMGSKRLVTQTETTQRQLSAQQREIRAKLSRARDEEQEMRGKITLYRQLVDRGVIGQEERLDWVEQIARIKSARRLLDLQYDLSPQKAIDETLLPGSQVADGYEFMASTMKLRMSLLHENDLLGFLADLRQAVHAHLLVRDCALGRAASAASERGLPAQLSAECTIDWITLREKKK